ncbi:MAG: PEP/pyruvate-binding domain-containing protein [Acidimicrobiia bacterium]|nr:PEP/pyruvate-binding domain-containing protein [Acidimicrobiia bacterium]
MVPLRTAAADATGGKGASLQWLAAHGYLIPDTWVLPPGAPGDLGDLDLGRVYAVRSSANVEDGDDASFAGQFETVLGVTGPQDVAKAIDVVRTSVTSEGVESYTDHMHAETPIRMSVLVQEMIEPVASGVVFTRNPITGLNEIILEAVEGRGDQLVQGGITPHRWVRKWGAWTSQPDDPILTDELATAIVEEAAEIADDYGAAADLEWVWDGEQVWWLQIRPITGTGDVHIYSNRISKEVLPGLIKPLVWSVNVPVVNKAWIRLFTEAIGDNDLEPEDLAETFAYRAYFNMGAIGDIFELMGMPRDSLESLLGLPPGPDQPKMKPSRRTLMKTPRLITFAVGRSRYGRKIETALPQLRYRYQRFDRDLTEMSDDDLLTSIDQLMDVSTEAAYSNIVVPLLANVYTGLLRRRLAANDLDLTQIDLGIDGDPAHDADPNAELDRLADTIEAHGAESTEAADHLDLFLARFGHFSDSGNDFSVATWAEQPDLVMQMAAARGRSQRIDRMRWDEATADLGAMTTITTRPIRKRAVTYQVRRDQVSSLYTYGYGLFRLYFLELGRRLADRAVIGEADDIMYLTLDEVRAAVLGALSADDAQRIVADHKAELDRVADLDMPEVIYGDEFIPAAPTSPNGLLTGVATSRGHYRGPVRVVRGLADFDQVSDGDVLAIPFSDVGWTPLFAKAGAVIAESGGMLSHSSIVAREYGIPCVVSVNGAMRLEDGAIVTVDGYRGEIVIG